MISAFYVSVLFIVCLFFGAFEAIFLVSDAAALVCRGLYFARNGITNVVS